MRVKGLYLLAGSELRGGRALGRVRGIITTAVQEVVLLLAPALAEHALAFGHGGAHVYVSMRDSRVRLELGRQKVVCDVRTLGIVMLAWELLLGEVLALTTLGIVALPVHRQGDGMTNFNRNHPSAFMEKKRI